MASLTNLLPRRHLPTWQVRGILNPEAEIRVWKENFVSGSDKILFVS